MTGERQFTNKVALVTGAASGIGSTTAIAFAKQGADLILADVKTSATTFDQVESFGAKVISVEADVSQAKDVEKLFRTIEQKFGRLDIAFNNAGIEGVPALTAECTEENWDRVLNINLKGIWLCMREELRLMEKNGGGAIVNCASVAGLVGFPTSAAYVASKHGVLGLTKTAALEYATKNIRINAVCPGVIQTPMIDRFVKGDSQVKRAFEEMEPIGRFGQPEEIASGVMWLCSPEASFVVGHGLTIDGGMTAR